MAQYCPVSLTDIVIDLNIVHGQKALIVFNNFHANNTKTLDGNIPENVVINNIR